MKTTKKIVLAAIAGTALLAASGAQARDDHWNHGNRGHYQGHYYRHAPYRVVVRPAPYYYARPAPVYYAPPAPVYYAPPRPVIYGQIPLGHHSGISFRLPL